MRRTLFTKAPLLLLFFLYCTCTVEEFGHKSEQLASFTLAQARADFESNATDLQPVEYLLSQNQTKASLFENIVPVWKKSIAGQTDRFELYMIPLNEVSGVHAMLSYTQGKKKTMFGEGVQVASHLVIQRFTKTQKTRRFITTVVGVEKEPQKGNNPYLYMGSRANFEGFLLISAESGKCIEAYYYYAGKRYTMHILDQAPTKEEKENNVLLQSSAGFAFFNKSISTKGSGGYATGEEDGSYCYNCHQIVNFLSGTCSNCGAKPENIGEGDLYFFCAKCGRLEEDCTCCLENENPFACSMCGREPCICEDETYCPLCHNPHCNGECSGLGKGEGEDGGEPEDPPTIPKYEISLLATAGGSTTGGGEYEKGYTVSISALCNYNYTFGGWSENASLISMSSAYSFPVTTNRCLTANFHSRDSDCGKLATKYKNNSNLKRNINSLKQQKAICDTIEFTYVRSTTGIEEMHVGTSTSTKFELAANTQYEYILHNHFNTPIPSPEDLIALYNAYQSNKFPIGSSLIMQTENGCISIEIENFDTFELFALGCLKNKKTVEIFHDCFFRNILGNPKKEELGNQSITDKAIAYFLEHGLKLAYTPGDGSGLDWSYAQKAGTTVNYNDCIH